MKAIYGLLLGPHCAQRRVDFLLLSARLRDWYPCRFLTQ